MSKILLMALAATVAASSMAAPENPQVIAARAGFTTSKAAQPKKRIAATQRLGKNASMTVVRNEEKTVKQMNVVNQKNVINPRLGKTAVNAPAGSSFFESFEGETFEATGWTVESKIPVSPETEFTGWGIGGEELSMMGITAPDGNQIAYINFCSDPVEEWLISPKFTVHEKELLSFWTFMTPAFFNSTDNIDWDTMEYIGEPVRLGDLEVMIRQNEGEWTRLASIMDQYAGKSFEELLTTETGNWSFSLSGHEGENVQIAFKYSGTDVNSVGIDIVNVAMPSLDGVALMEPLDMLYWGTDRSENWNGLNLTLAMAPVQAPLTWTNYSDYVEGATYSWTYHDPVTNDLATTDDEELTVTYQPDFSSDFTRRNNLYYAPVLTGSAEGSSDGTATRGYTYLQAGGKPEFQLTGGEIMEFGLMPYPQNVDGNTALLIDSPEVGDAALPVFGHNANVDKYWLNYTLNGEEPSEGDYVHLNGYCNFMYAPSRPLVVNGIHTMAVGQYTDAANFRCDIYALTDEMVIDDENIIATAYCPASKVMSLEGATNHYLTIPFDFEQPVILQASEQCAAYVVKISGFNSDAVPFFVPIQSDLPEPNSMCFGWVEKKIYINGMTEEERQSFTPIAYVDGENGPCYNAFAINLEGYYPFLACDTERVEMTDAETAEVVLGSYYDGADLTIEAPAGIEATAEGRYDSCVLKLKANANVSGTVKISAPGVEHSIFVSATSGIIDIDAYNSEISEIYTLDGRKVNSTDLVNGIYIVRHIDGSVHKALKK